MATPQNRYVFFDLETSGLYPSNPDIIQIGAVTFDGEDSFDIYLHPTKSIQIKASNVNNLYYIKETNLLFRKVGAENYRRCYTLPPKEGLEKFLKWLKDDVGENVVLVAYNGFKFDGRILLKKIREFQIKKKLADVIVGFIDPFETSKEHFPKQKSRSMNSMMTLFNLSNDSSGQTHNALFDSADMRNLTMAMFKSLTVGRYQDMTWSSFYMKYFKTRAEIEADI